MNRTMGAVLLVIGVVLLVYGFNAEHSMSSSVSKFFEGTPTNKTIALLVLGGISSVMGLLTLFGRSGSR